MINVLTVIPARGGSKGIPKKNIKPLNGKPLIHYSIDIARQLFNDEDICVSTDSEEIKDVAEQTGLVVPFLRPDELATDHATSQDAILHALELYENLRNKKYDAVLLLQPTSPFRLSVQVEQAVSLFTNDIDMVVSVVESSQNPYYNLFELNENNYMEKSKPGHYTRRQDCPKVYEINGSIYVMNTSSLRSSLIGDFKKVMPFDMPEEYSIDIDTPLDWSISELYLSNGLVSL